MRYQERDYTTYLVLCEKRGGMSLESMPLWIFSEKG